MNGYLYPLVHARTPKSGWAAAGSLSTTMVANWSYQDSVDA